MCQTIDPRPQCLKFEISNLYTVLILHGPGFRWAPDLDGFNCRENDKSLIISRSKTQGFAVILTGI